MRTHPEMLRELIRISELPRQERLRIPGKYLDRLRSIPSVVINEERDRYWRLIDEIKGHRDTGNSQLANTELSSVLKDSINNCLSQTFRGYLYIKRWTLSADQSWIKVGITNDPNRRDQEQNVLPVAAETIELIELESMDLARSIEKALHSGLKQWKINDARNKEIFELDNANLLSLLDALGHLQKRLEANDSSL